MSTTANGAVKCWIWQAISDIGLLRHSHHTWNTKLFIRNNSKIYFNSLHRSWDVNWSKVYFRIAKQPQSCFSVWVLRRLQILLLPFQLGITPIDPDVVSNQDCQQCQQWLRYVLQYLETPDALRPRDLKTCRAETLKPWDFDIGILTI